MGVTSDREKAAVRWLIFVTKSGGRRRGEAAWVAKGLTDDWSAQLVWRNCEIGRISLKTKKGGVRGEVPVLRLAPYFDLVFCIRCLTEMLSIFS